jgi:hypothetical protein
MMQVSKEEPVEKLLVENSGINNASCVVHALTTGFWGLNTSSLSLNTIDFTLPSLITIRFGRGANMHVILSVSCFLGLL